MYIFPEVEDTSGEARVRGTTSAPVPPPAEAGPSAPHQAVASAVDVTEPKVSRMTEWRRKKTGKKNNEHCHPKKKIFIPVTVYTARGIAGRGHVMNTRACVKRHVNNLALGTRALSRGRRRRD